MTRWRTRPLRRSATWRTANSASGEIVDQEARDVVLDGLGQTRRRGAR